MPHRPRPLLAALFLSPSLLLLSACAQSPTAPALPPDDVIRSAQQQLTDDCLKRQGLTPPRPHHGNDSHRYSHSHSHSHSHSGDYNGTASNPRNPGEQSVRAQERTAAALFGTGRTELSLKLATGYTVRAHTDGCLAAAQRTLYGDQRRWFEVSTIANNLKPEAAYRHRTLTSVRAEHRQDLADWRTLHTHALHQATTRLTAQQQREKHAS
ncbi:hypothetical protein ACFVXC_35925 [Streptomyces sp. NPDC058257]|uniref:hypothetical protein n=1 Tax=Streptomyces sp. NPDC058257 TaxID=3346409 RepID=UPI0036E71E7A